MSETPEKDVCEEKVYRTLFNLHAENLYQFLYHRYGDQLDPMDKAQEAFVKLWQNCKKVTPDKAKSFVFTIGNNLMLNAYKHLKVVREHEAQVSSQKDHYDPQFLLEEKEYHEKYKRALATLTDAQREVFLLNRAEGKRHKEIAALLGISRKAVEKRLYGALDKMKSQLKEL
ncbi:RNA polymerase sigma factor [Croceiramulus getboli]|nr:RNA polymerase sigma factor [Flavobacteriaceae bacterium YJPT1-3]